MGCDGIWEKYSNEEICDMIEAGLNKKLNGVEILS
jgi:serine/threonine protein phosphatase PrpC